MPPAFATAELAHHQIVLRLRISAATCVLEAVVEDASLAATVRALVPFTVASLGLTGGHVVPFAPASRAGARRCLTHRCFAHSG